MAVSIMSEIIKCDGCGATLPYESDLHEANDWYDVSITSLRYKASTHFYHFCVECLKTKLGLKV